MPASITVKNGETYKNAVLNGENMYVLSGGSAVSTSIPDGILYVSGTAKDTIVSNNSSVYVYDGGMLDGIRFSKNTDLWIYAGAVVSDAVMEAGAKLHADTASSVRGTNELGAFRIADGAAEGLVLSAYSSFTVRTGDSAASVLLKKNAQLLVESGASVSDTVLQRGGVLNVADGAILRNTTAAGTVSLSGSADAQNSSFVFELSARRVSDDCILNDISLLDNANFSVSVSSGQKDGTFSLAGGAGAFSGTISLTVDNVASGLSFVIENGTPTRSTVYFRAMKYAIDTTGGTLSLTMSEFSAPELSVTQSPELKQTLLSWTAVGETGNYIVELARDESFEAVVRISPDNLSAALLNLEDGTYFARVRSSISDAWSESVRFTTTGNTESAVLSGDIASDNAFFAVSRDVWTSLYYAYNVFTGNEVSLEGRNRFRDMFSGSDETWNTLLLTDTENGDAFFLDDVYSEFGESGRFSRIQEIRAGAGCDLIDLTSAKFHLSESIILRGGAGDDLLWTGDVENSLLLGDEGNDSLEGHEGADVLSGCASDDLLSGNGGDDLFLFCADWGRDAVSQLPGEENTVTLWFSGGTVSSSDRDGNAVFTDGENSVVVYNRTVSEIAVKYGDDGSERYRTLSGQGAFDAYSSRSVYEQVAAAEA